MNLNPSDDLFYLGVKVILKNPQNQILLLKVQRPKKSFWELPGGRVQKLETEVQAVYRELLEETGIKNIKNLKSIYLKRSDYRCKTFDEQDVGLIFSFFQASVDNSDVSLSVDHAEYAWVSIQEADQLLKNGYGCLVSELVKS